MLTSALPKYLPVVVRLSFFLLLLAFRSILVPLMACRTVCVGAGRYLRGMQLVTMSDVDTADFEDAVSESAYSKGRTYARQRAVIAMRWDSSAQALHGKVRGRLGDFYDTTAYFSSYEETPLAYQHGECSCPVGVDCKHVAALVLTAIDPERARGIAPRSSQAVRPAAGNE